VAAPENPNARPRCPKCGSPTVIPVGAAKAAPRRHALLAVVAVLLVTAAAAALVIAGYTGGLTSNGDTAVGPAERAPSEDASTSVASPTPTNVAAVPPDPAAGASAKKTVPPKPTPKPTAGVDSPPEEKTQEATKTARTTPDGPEPWKETVEKGDALRDTRQLPEAASAYREALELLDEELAALAQRREDLRRERHLVATKLDTVEQEAYPDGYYTSIRHLPPRLQIHRLGAWLFKAYGMALHEDIQVEDGVVVAIDLSRAGKRVRDLVPLRGIPLRNLNINGTRVVDLSPLEGMPLRKLLCSGTAVRELTPLRGMPLEELDLRETKVTDLSPIAEASLTLFYPPPREALADESKAIAAQLERQGCLVVWRK
jgi:outer membrane biosynthesis protein TonB